MRRVLFSSMTVACTLGFAGCDAAAPRTADTGAGLAPTGLDTEGESPSSTKGDDAEPTGSADETEGDDGSGDDGRGPKFDLGSTPEPEPLEPDECTKVDILFMIDNSGSMQNEQENLIAAFPGFVAGMESALEQAETYHIGIVTSDSYDQNTGGCDGLGDLVEQCGGHTSGYRWFDNNEPNLASTFACEAAVGVNGDAGERQVDGVLRAVSPNRNAPGECNEGFIRDDALLVVVLITDEEDEEDCSLFGLDCDGGSNGGPQDWYDKLVAHKGGIEENVVVLSLIGRPGSGCAENAGRIAGFTERFTNHSLGDICAGGYDAFFTEAISEVDTACELFTPPG